MKMLKTIIVLFTFVISMLIIIDHSFSSYIETEAIENPLQSDCSDNSIHQHMSEKDHYFQKTPIADYNIQPAGTFKVFLQNQSIADKYISSIWQPPRHSC